VSVADPSVAQSATVVLAAGVGISAERIGTLLENSWIVQSAFGALIGVLLTWFGALFGSRKRIAWRAYMDDLPKLERQQQRSIAGTGVNFAISVDKTDERTHRTVAEKVDDPTWLVLLRVRNSGFVTIGPEDFNIPLTFTFPGRKVAGKYVIRQDPEFVAQVLGEPEPVNEPRRTVLERMFPFLATPLPADANEEQRREQLRLSNRFSLNRGQRFELMVVLSGTPPTEEDRKVIASGAIVGGKIIKEKPRRGPATRSLVFGGGATLTLAGLLIGLFVATPTTQNSGSCAGGSLTLTGSTAFAPVARQIAEAYVRACPSATITIQPDSSGSVFGLNTLVSDGQQGHAGGEIAMSDGPAPSGSGYGSLVGEPVAIIIFSVAVNAGVGNYNLTTGQIRGMFSGTITNWNMVGGPNLPVRVISREFGSGTRRAFDTFVLGGDEQSPSSFDCVHRNVASSPVILCNETKTSDELRNISTVPGAVGYAQTGDLATFSGGGINQVALNGLSPSYGNLG
jgi:ABC-type phosphate transport system substrate-binding protein